MLVKGKSFVTIYTAAGEKAREIYRAISAFLSSISVASQLSLEAGKGHSFRYVALASRGSFTLVQSASLM